jgi:hypothetical protein
MNTRISQLFGVGLDVEIARINMRLVMIIQKRNDGLSLRNLLHICRTCDANNSGSLDRENFEKALKKYK